MKMKSLFLAIAGLVLMSMQSYAQYLAAPAGTLDATTPDYVTIGSIVPYYVTPDATISALAPASMDYSNFWWEVLNGSSTTPGAALGLTPMKNSDGTGSLDVGEGAGTWVTQNRVYVTWSAPAVAGTQYVIRAREHSNPLGLGNFASGCEGTPTLRDVFVLAPPKAAFTTASGGGCSIDNTTVNIPLTVRGLGSFTVKYTVSVNGGAAGAEQTAVMTVTDPTAAEVSADVIAESVKDRTATFTYDVPNDVFGTHVFTITSITDRISRKALNTLPASTSAIGATDIGSSTAATYTLNVVPTPSTGAIQHIANGI